MKTPSRSELNEVGHAELVGLVLELLKRVDVLEAENAALRARCEKLEEQVRESKRAGAPFSKGNLKAEPKKAGRKAGKGLFQQRPAPVVGAGDEVEDVLVPLKSRECSLCGTTLEVSEELATVEDTPPQPTRRITRFHVEVGVCPQCGWRGRGTHADLPAGQHGASGHRVGPQILAQGLSLHYCHGLPLCKVPAVLKEMTGIDLSQSALTQAAGTLCRPGGRLATLYAQLRERIQSAAVVNTDDTGWRIGGRLAFLMGFFTSTEAVYQIRWQHRHEEVQEMLGAAFTGLLGTDRGTSYEAQALADIEQQKCLSHLLKNLSEVEKTAQGRGKCFARDVKATLREALALWQEHRAGRCSRRAYEARGKPIEEKLTRLLRDRVLTDADNQRLLDGIGSQHDRGRVLLFLRRPEIEPTNNRAERGLRPAVIARKISHCSKNERGASIYETMKSITATLALRGYRVASTLADLIRGMPMPAPSGR